MSVKLPSMTEYTKELPFNTSVENTRIVQRAYPEDPILFGHVGVSPTGDMFFSLDDKQILRHTKKLSKNAQVYPLGLVYTILDDALRIAAVFMSVSATSKTLLCWSHIINTITREDTYKNIQELSFEGINNCVFYGVQTMTAQTISDEGDSRLSGAVVYSEQETIKGIPIVLSQESRLYMEQIAEKRKVDIAGVFPNYDVPFVVSTKTLHLVYTKLPSSAQLHKIKFSRGILKLTFNSSVDFYSTERRKL